MKLPNIKVDKKTGLEKFELNGKRLEFNLNEFWSWKLSNLIENRNRGILAEFIVKKALGIENYNRIEWDDYDLITKHGNKIEIKSAAYIQTWEQNKFSNISFNISKTASNSENPENNETYKRWSDYYVFCILDCKNQNKINPLNLSQWTFYVLKTEILNEKVNNQKTIGLNHLLSLNPIKAKYDVLKKIIK